MTDSATLVVYEKPTCTTCRKMVKLLKEHGVEFERLDYFIEPIPRRKLKEFLKKMGLGPRGLLRTRERAYKDLGLNDPEISDEALLDALVEHPELIQRPIVERGGRAVLDRPVEKVLELLYASSSLNASAIRPSASRSSFRGFPNPSLRYWSIPK